MTTPGQELPAGPSAGGGADVVDPPVASSPTPTSRALKPPSLAAGPAPDAHAAAASARSCQVRSQLGH